MALLFLTKRLCSPALPQLAEALWTQVLSASDRGDLRSVVRRESHFDVICQVLGRDPRLPPEMWNLGMFYKIYSRAKSCQHNSRDSSAVALQKVQRFRFTIESLHLVPFASPSDPAWLWQHKISWQDIPHSQTDFDWLVDYLSDACSTGKDHETAGDILVLLSSMKASCSLDKQHLYIEKLIVCMDSNMPPRLRHAALRAAHTSREVLASINVLDDANMVLTDLSLAILTAVCPQPGARPTSGDPDCFFDDDRDLCYLELVFALAENPHWRPHLYCQMDRVIMMIPACCKLDKQHAGYLVGIFLRMSSEQVPSSITDHQWWEMMTNAWHSCSLTDDPELLSVLVEGTRRHMYINSKPYLEQLVRDADDLIRNLEGQGLEQGERDAIATELKRL
ncbi:hypothetical protein EV424DRAFT_399576 [Suillus variegatus]|nr:hypothetical protein EV424DRAFT_399576 [Suillus variegatus]